MKKYFLTIIFSFLTFFIGQSSLAFTPLEDISSLYNDADLETYLNYNDENLTALKGSGGNGVGGTAFGSSGTLFDDNYLTLGGFNQGWWHDAGLTTGYSKNFSISRWIYPTVDNGYYLSTQQTSATTNILNFKINSGLYFETTFNADSGTLRTMTASEAMTLNAWNHIVITRNDNEMTTYLNGEIVAYINNASTGTNYWGARHYWHMNWTDAYGTSGKEDDFSAWTKTLTADEVYTLYSGQLPATPLSITLTAYNTSTQQLILIGNCEPAGSGLNQIKIQGFNGTATSTPDYANWDTAFDPWRGDIADCSTSTESWTGVYNGAGLSGTKWIGAIDFQGGLTPVSAVATTTDFSFVGIDWSDPANFFTSPATSTANYTAAHNAACTPEQWALSASSTSLIHLCPIKESIYVVLFGMRDFIAAIINGFITAVSNLFPFNLIAHIITSWTDSTATLPTSLNYFNIVDQNGDIGFTIGGTMIGSTSTVIVFGNSINNATSGTTGFFAVVRALTTFGFYIGLIWYCYEFGWKIYNEINYEKTIQNHEKINYQL